MAKKVKKEKKLVKRAGRPPLPPSEVLLTIATRVEPRVLRRLKRRAARRGIDLSAYLRLLCKRAVRKDKTATPTVNE